MADPWPFYRKLRAEHPVWQDPRSKIFFVGSYALAEEVMKSPNRYSSRVDRTSMRAGGLPDEALSIKAQGYPPALTLSHNDGPSHAVFRSLVTPFFSPRRMRALEPFLAATSERLIGALAARGGGDFVAGYAVPLPIAAISHHIGLDDFEPVQLKRWSDAIADEIGFSTSDERAIEASRLGVECQTALVALAEKRRADPRDDIVSVLANARVEEDRLLSSSEVLSVLIQLLVAGNETTTNSLSGGMLRLASDADLAGRLRADPSLIPLFVEEVLRLESAVQGQFRMAAVDSELGGVAIPAGSLIHVRFASANRDESVYGDTSDVVMIEGRQPKPHLAFGSGMHFCVGAQLSRLEMRIAFTQLIEAFETIALETTEQKLSYPDHFHLRGLQSLPLRLS